MTVKYCILYRYIIFYLSVIEFPVKFNEFMHGIKCQLYNQCQKEKKKKKTNWNVICVTICTFDLFPMQIFKPTHLLFRSS